MHTQFLRALTYAFIYFFWTTFLVVSLYFGYTEMKILIFSQRKQSFLNEGATNIKVRKWKKKSFVFNLWIATSSAIWEQQGTAVSVARTINTADSSPSSCAAKAALDSASTDSSPSASASCVADVVPTSKAGSKSASARAKKGTTKT